jgi:hypothetical protein
MDEVVQGRKGSEEDLLFYGALPRTPAFALGAEMVWRQRKREGPVLNPSRISASGSVLGVLASISYPPASSLVVYLLCAHCWKSDGKNNSKLGLDGEGSHR